MIRVSKLCNMNDNLRMTLYLFYAILGAPLDTALASDYITWQQFQRRSAQCDPEAELYASSSRNDDSAGRDGYMLVVSQEQQDKLGLLNGLTRACLDGTPDAVLTIPNDQKTILLFKVSSFWILTLPLTDGSQKLSLSNELSTNEHFPSFNGAVSYAFAFHDLRTDDELYRNVILVQRELLFRYKLIEKPKFSANSNQTTMHFSFELIEIASTIRWHMYKEVSDTKLATTIRGTRVLHVAAYAFDLRKIYSPSGLEYKAFIFTNDLYNPIPVSNILIDNNYFHKSIEYDHLNHMASLLNKSYLLFFDSSQWCFVNDRTSALSVELGLLAVAANKFNITNYSRYHDKRNVCKHLSSFCFCRQSHSSLLHAWMIQSMLALLQSSGEILALKIQL
ncbi:hypothetical protein GZH46_01206, partial [Fragariocoptes setiger]